MATEKRLIDANALDFEPDSDCVANGVLIWGGRGGKTMTTVLAALKKMVDNAPTVDAVEVVHGHKVVKERIRGIAYTMHCPICNAPIPSNKPYIEKVEYCSVCGKRLDDTFQNYCPNCGAKMDGDGDEIH